MKARILFSALVALGLTAASFTAGAQAVNYSHSGILTSGYTWAYGTWHVKESVPDSDADENDFYISIDKYQIRIKDRSLPDIPLACIPETNYTYNEMDADMFDLGPDEKLLEFVGRYGEDIFLIINRKDKTLSHFNESDRRERGIKVTMEKADAGAPSAAYADALASSPIVGTWRSADDPADVLTITPQNIHYEFILRSDGSWERYIQGILYRYNADTGTLSVGSPFDTDGLRTRLYEKAN